MVKPDPKQQLKKLRAEVRRYRRLYNIAVKESDLVNRIVGIVSDAIVSAEPVPKPVLPKIDGADHDETVVLFLSDVHVGKKTASYNHKVFVRRLNYLGERMMAIVGAQRSIRPLRKLVIAWGGDIVDCEAIYPAQAVEHISVPIIDQIFSVGVPAFTNFLEFCLQNFEEVECHCVRGNHGRQTGTAKWSSSRSTNWDHVLYKSLEQATSSQDRIKWVIRTKDWKDMFRVERHGMLLTHGSQIRRYYSLPHYGITRQSMRWQTAYRKRMSLDYFLFGHFHSAGIYRFNQVVCAMNGSFVSDDEFAEEYLGVGSVPEQILFAVHPKYGMTWRFVLQLK